MTISKQNAMRKARMVALNKAIHELEIKVKIRCLQEDQNKLKDLIHARMKMCSDHK